MKKIIFLIIIVVLILVIVPAVYAAEETTPPNMVTTYLTWDFLGTMAGAVAATTLLTQFLKLPIDKVWKIPTRFVVYVLAIFLLFAYEYFFGQITIDKAILLSLNAIIVTLAAMGTYEATFKVLEHKTPSG